MESFSGTTSFLKELNSNTLSEESYSPQQHRFDYVTSTPAHSSSYAVLRTVSQSEADNGPTASSRDDACVSGNSATCEVLRHIRQIVPEAVDVTYHKLRSLGVGAIGDLAYLEVSALDDLPLTFIQKKKLISKPAWTIEGLEQKEKDVSRVTEGELHHGGSAAESNTRPTFTLQDEPENVSPWDALAKYKLPKFPPHLDSMMKCADGLPATDEGHRVKGLIVTHLFTDISVNYNTVFPAMKDRFFYTKVASRLLNQYPNLAIGLVNGDAIGLYSKLLSKRFKLTRRVINTPATQAMKRKYGEPQKDGERKRQELEKARVTCLNTSDNVPEADGEAEDASTVAVLKRKLAAEAAKRGEDRNMPAIIDKINRTRPDRLQLTATPGHSAQDVLEQYPIFKNGEMISADVEQQMKRPAALLNKVFTYADIVVASGKGAAAEYQAELKQLPDNAEYKYLAQLAVLPTLFRERPGAFVKFVEQLPVSEEELPLEPVLVVERREGSLLQFKTLVVHVDRQPLLSSQDVMSALRTLFASFWFFNCHYPKRLRSTYTFLECVSEYKAIDKAPLLVQKLYKKL